MKLRRRIREWWTCRTKRCSYYQHYLAYGPKELEHEGYHAAERKCYEAQERVERWFKAHPRGLPPDHLVKYAEKWEARVRA